MIRQEALHILIANAAQNVRFRSPGEQKDVIEAIALLHEEAYARPLRSFDLHILQLTGPLPARPTKTLVLPA